MALSWLKWRRFRWTRRRAGSGSTGWWRPWTAAGPSIQTQVRAQAEGWIVMGASSALLEEVTVEDGRVAATSFADYPIMTAVEAPEIETVILETPDREPSGAGEPPIGPIALAIGYVFFAPTGVRMRRLPMSQERVRTALRERESLDPAKDEAP